MSEVTSCRTPSMHLCLFIPRNVSGTSRCCSSSGLSIAYVNARLPISAWAASSPNITGVFDFRAFYRDDCCPHFQGFVLPVRRLRLAGSVDLYRQLLEYCSGDGRIHSLGICRRLNFPGAFFLVSLIPTKMFILLLSYRIADSFVVLYRFQDEACLCILPKGSLVRNPIPSG